MRQTREKEQFTCFTQLPVACNPFYNVNKLISRKVTSTENKSCMWEQEQFIIFWLKVTKTIFLITCTNESFIIRPGTCTKKVNV